MKSFSACDIIVTLFIGGFFLMAKKKNVNLTTVIVAALALVALIMMFLPALSYKSGDTVKNFSTFNALFGKTIREDKVGSRVTYTLAFKFNFVTLLACLFILIGLVVSVLNVFGILNNKLIGLVVCILLIVAAVLMLVLCDITPVVSHDIVTDKDTVDKFSALPDAKLGTGAIIAGITAGLAGLVSVWKAAYNK